MKNKMMEILKDMQFTEPVNETKIGKAEMELDISFPKQYRDFLKITNGAEGPIGENGYLALWPLDLLVKINGGSKTRSFLPGLIMFGSDGGDETYAFDFNRNCVVLDVPFAACDMDETEMVAETFDEFIFKQTEK